MPLGVVGKKSGDDPRVYRSGRFCAGDGTCMLIVIVSLSSNSTTVMAIRRFQVTYGERKPSRVNKALSGHYAKASVAAGEGLCEFRLSATETLELAPGAELKADLFASGQKVQVTGISKGKGFAGTIKRHNFRGQDNSHGNSISHRVPGSTGMCQTPGRVFKGKKMSGQMGNQQVSTKNLTVVSVDKDRDLLLIKGAVPGAKGGRVIVRPLAAE